MSGGTAPSPWTVVLLPGDGIGPEVVQACRPLMERVSAIVADRYGAPLQFEEAMIGGVAVDATGTPLPPATLEQARRARAVFLGAVGGPRWDSRPPAERPEAGLLQLRRELGVFANLRPVWELPATVPSPLRAERVRGLDVLLVRELTGGLYFGEPRGRETRADGRRAAVDTMRYDEDEIRRVAHVAFRAARGRRRRVTSVDKANVLASSQLWREVVSEVAREYPDVTLEHHLVDRAAMGLVAEPTAYDVVLTENLFGDILSDLLGGVAGHLGVLPSASLGDRDPGLYEPVHGSAPDIAGQDRANPAGALFSFGMLCQYSLGLDDVAAAVREAVQTVLATAPTSGTRAFGEAALREFERRWTARS